MSKILSIVWYKVLPPKFGGQKGTALFNKYLAKQNEIVCLCSQNNEETEGQNYKIIPKLPISKFQFFDPFCWLQVLKIAKKEKVTHLILEHPYHGIAGWISKKSLKIKLVVHSHNIESQRFKEQNKWWWKLLAVYERWTHRNADLNFFKTTSDRDFAIREFNLKPEKCVLVPFGIEVEPGKPTFSRAKVLIRERYGIQPKEKILLYAGTLDYKPNAEAVESIYNEIAPRLKRNSDFKFKILVFGRNHLEKFQYLKKLRDENVIYAGEVDDIKNYFAGADVFINPSKPFSGTQTKLIEALSYHLNVVIFANQVYGLNQEVCGNKIFIAEKNDWYSFTQKIIIASENSFPTPTEFFQYYDWYNCISGALKAINLFLSFTLFSLSFNLCVE